MVSVADITWVMRTIDRAQFDPPRQNYLGATLARLADSHGDQRPVRLHLVESGGSKSPDAFREDAYTALGESRHDQVVPVWHVTADNTRLTNNQNAIRALHLGVTSREGWIVHLEDDLDVCDDVFGSIARWLTDYAEGTGHPLYTFHAPYAGVKQLADRGIPTWEYPVKNFYGNQCWAMRREAAASALAYLTKVVPTWRSGQGFDLILKDWATATYPGVPFLASCPSFVQHVGGESSLHLGRFHQNSSWPGREWTYRSRASVEVANEESR